MDPITTPTAAAVAAPTLPPATTANNILDATLAPIPTPTPEAVAAPSLPPATTAFESDDSTATFSDDSDTDCAFDIGSDNETDISVEYDTDEDNADFFTSLAVANYDGALEDVVFADTDLLALKEKEQSMRQKKENKYYRCKQRDAKLYEQIREAYLPHVTLAKIAMLNHPHHTQGNEAMNTSVMSYAPKSKTFCKTKSLETRVGIAAGVMILGYEKLWVRIFNALQLEMDTALLHLV